MPRTNKKVVHKESDKAPRGSKRSTRWPSVRRKFIKNNPCCAVCGASKGKLEVHHIVPFHIDKELELDPSNLITLCENMNDGVSCHLLFGHLGSYRSYNVNVRKDASLWAKKLKQRPK